MAGLQAADRGVEEVTGAVVDHAARPSGRGLQSHVEARGSSYECREDRPSVGAAVWRLERGRVALVRPATGLPGGESRIRLEGDAVAGHPATGHAVGRKREAGFEHPSDTRVHHPGHRRVGPPHRRARARRPVGLPPGELVASGSAVAPAAKHLAQAVPRLPAVEPHKPPPVGRPALVLDQRSRLAEGQIEAAEPAGRLAEKTVEGEERIEFADGVEMVDGVAGPATESPHRHGDRLSRPRRRGEVDAEQHLTAATDGRSHEDALTGMSFSPRSRSAAWRDR